MSRRARQRADAEAARWLALAPLPDDEEPDDEPDEEQPEPEGPEE